ncbi:MAG: metallophosphoesterase [Terracidiphilus sp.]
MAKIIKHDEHAKHAVHTEPARKSKGPGKPPLAKGKPKPVVASGQPIFGEPTLSPDPTTFTHPVTDQSLKQLTQLIALPANPTGAPVEPVLTLAQVYGDAGPAKEAAIVAAGQIVFHSVGDTGSVTGPATQSLVADKMVSDFTEANPADVPSFFFHLGDIVYYFGEATYYYDQFYAPYREYPAPILAIAGNHDGVVYAKDPAVSLEAYLENFCAAAPTPGPDAGNLNRTTITQPGVYFTFEAPFVRILGLYSNVLEDPGVISGQIGSTSPNKILDSRQIAFLTAALKRVKSDAFAGAVIIAVHHPPYSGDTIHGGSPLMLADIDSACTAAGVWPHAVFSGHVHNYERFTRTVAGKQIAYMVAGCGGHNPLSKMRATLRTPYVINSTLTLESVDYLDYGYLRVVVNSTTMTIEFHPESDGGTVKTPDDKVTINLANYTLS